MCIIDLLQYAGLLRIEIDGLIHTKLLYVYDVCTLMYKNCRYLPFPQLPFTSNKKRKRIKTYQRPASLIPDCTPG